MTDPSPWWRDAVVYQLYIRSFTDADGNGIGDIDGMRSRRPYLRDLGVDAVWVNPWFVSPMVDGGYDVADYRDIDPLFGDLADAEAFLDEAHALGIRVLLDIVPNHTSDRHPWFQAALAAGPPGGGQDLPEDLLEDPTWVRSGHTVRGRDGCRVPLPWSGMEPPFGFGPPGSRAWLPRPLGWHDRTVDAERSGSARPGWGVAACRVTRRPVGRRSSPSPLRRLPARRRA